jgi:hypothetical protein
MSKSADADGHTWPPKLTVAGVAIDVDMIDGEANVVWLYDRSGRRIAEVLDVTRITIGVEDPPDI